ncbi:MAG: formylglycine-generating enzyme family protein, partial [Deltaproteobacteria bacterium]|nr:formylglycine-generating enzyme family protein [Deltaproteobacteria bacterium]
QGKESHPVVNVSWEDAQVYCEWLSRLTHQEIRLPTEIEWEKAARGAKDKRIYPWGDRFDAMRCNTYELGLRDTTPVGIFQNGASPYGCLDMLGNVWEWCLDWFDEEEQKFRVLRGGAWINFRDFARCSSRYWDLPYRWANCIGFRVLAAPISEFLNSGFLES